MDAVKRGTEMMHVPMNQLPPLAVEFAKKLCREVGGCMEVLLTAYVVYAQLVEGLPCDDDLYTARDVDKAWFAKAMLMQQVAVSLTEEPEEWN
jgi:hypothetical protein